MNNPVRRLTQIEWLIFLLLMLLAFWLRVNRFLDAPPGIIHDEVRNWLNVQMILSGDIRALYPYGGGREALYLFVEAASHILLGDNLLAARLPSVMINMIGIALSFSIGRRLFGRGAGFTVVAGMTTSFWAIMFSRLAVRSGMMPVMALGTTYLYLRLIRSKAPSRWHYLLAGAMLGLTLYTYPSALIFPIVLAAWFGFIWLTDKDSLTYIDHFQNNQAITLVPPSEAIQGGQTTKPQGGKSLLDRFNNKSPKWLNLGLSLLLAGLIAIPLIQAWRDPTTRVRADTVSGPLDAFLAGDPDPMLANIVPVLGVFSVQGDHGLEFNLQNQAIFPTPLIAGLFYIGLLIALVGLFRQSKRRTGYALILLWLIAMLAPTLATERPVNPYRTIGVMGVVYLFPAVAAVNLSQWAKNRNRYLSVSIWGIVILAMGWQFAQTLPDYFTAWNDNPVVRFLYQDEYRIIAADLDQFNDESIALGGLTPYEMDHASMRLLMADDDLADSIGYFDPQTALLIPSGDGTVIVPDFVTLHPAISDYLSTIGVDSTISDDRTYTRYEFSQDDIIIGIPGMESFYSGEKLLINFEGISLIGTPEPGGGFTLLTFWKIYDSAPSPLRIFVHLSDGEGNVLAQSDVLGVPAPQWREGDLIIQAHDFYPPPESPQEGYSLNIGIYDPLSGIRLTTLNPQTPDYLSVELP